MEANLDNPLAVDGAGFAGTAIESAARLYSTDIGSGRNVMLLHGWTCDADDWRGQVPCFAQKYHTVTVELRGHGRSEVMPSGAYSPEDYVADIESLITTRYSGEPFILVAHSMGGQIAARLAARRPELVRAIVSIDGALGFSNEAAEVFATIANDMNGEDARGVVAAFFEHAYGPRTDPAHKRLHANRLQSVPLHVIRESFAPLFFGAGQVGIGEASATLCTGLTVPVYHLCIDPAQADRMRPWFSHPKSKVQVWSDAGHWIMQDRQDDVNAAVTSWIDSL